MQAILALEDGTAFRGTSFGAPGTTAGEACFNTSMTGYQEIITDPSYRGQLVAMTYPHIGNYGICAEDNESERPQLRALVVGELARRYSNRRATEGLEPWLARHGVPGIAGVDTRRLTRHLRERGTMRACLSTELSEAEAVEAARAAAPMNGSDFVHEVSTRVPYQWREVGDHLPPLRHRIVAYDFGIKRSILRCLRRAGFATTVVPAGTTAGEVMAMQPEGVFLSNGPGDPAALPGIVAEVRELIGKVPLFGICLGHQILALACGGRTYKLRFGHRGGNHPVKDLRTGEIAITAQNHGFAVEAASLPAGVEVTHMNLNDSTVEGLRLTGARAFSVQFHPEASPGPTEARALFAGFAGLIDDAAEHG